MRNIDRILQILADNCGNFISGARIASSLGLSRTAVWKSIEQLKEEGCAVEAVTNRGYRLLESPDILNASLIRNALCSTIFSGDVHILPTVDSTNIYAKGLASGGAPSGTVVLAHQQTGGKGRTGKSFHSPAGGLYMSVILRPALSSRDLMAVTASAASAVAMTLLDHKLTPQIKWVNDVFLNDRKICGILCEGTFSLELQTLDYLVAGIGINLQPDPHQPPELQDIITDIATESGLRLTRWETAVSVLRHFDACLAGIHERSFMEIYRKYSRTLGHRVRCTIDGREETALAVDFDRDAGLILQRDSGELYTLVTGSAAPI